jgi:hypothetical protein
VTVSAQSHLRTIKFWPSGAFNFWIFDEKGKLTLLTLYNNGFERVYPTLLHLESLFHTMGILILLSPSSPVSDWATVRFKHV